MSPLLDPLEKCFQPPSGKIPHCPPTWKIHPTPKLVYVGIRVSQTFSHVPLTIKYIILRHLIYVGVIIRLYESDNGFQFSMDQVILELEFEPETLRLLAGAVPSPIGLSILQNTKCIC